MIVTVTLNPTLDKTLSVPALRPGEVHRARFLRQDIGGKGINVSRALAALGVASIPIGFLGGATGRAMRDGLTAAGYDARFVDVPGETRQNLTLLDESTGVYTKINEPGPTIGPEHLAALHALVDELAAPGDLWALCGSLPPGAPADFYADLVTAVQARGARAILDTSEEALRLGLAARPAGIKPNSEEAAQALGQTVSSDEEHVIAVRRLCDLLAPATPPAPIVCLTRGARGLLLVCRRRVGDGSNRRRSPRAAPSARAMRHWRACCGRCPMAATPPRWRAVPWRAARPRRCRKGRGWGRACWSMSCGRR